MTDDYLRGIEDGLKPGIPNIGSQPWKVLEIAIKSNHPLISPGIYQAWLVRYGNPKLTKKQKLDLKDWGAG